MLIKKLKFSEKFRKIINQMSLPTEIEFEIIAFIPSNAALPAVCKGWNDEVSLFKKRAASKIWNWYSQRRLKDEVKNPTDLFRLKLREYKDEWIIDHPKFVSNKLRLERTQLNIQKKSDVLKWFLTVNQFLTMDDWNYVGF